TDDISFSYFYEPGVGGELPLKTHDLLLTIRLGQTRKFREKPPTPPVSKIATSKVPTNKVPPPVNHPSKLVQKTQPIVQPKVDPAKQQPVIAKTDTTRKTKALQVSH